MSNEYRGRITEGGELGEQFWKDLDAAFDRGEDLTKWLRTRGAYPTPSSRASRQCIRTHRDVIRYYCLAPIMCATSFRFFYERFRYGRSYI